MLLFLCSTAVASPGLILPSAHPTVPLSARIELIELFYVTAEVGVARNATVYVGTSPVLDLLASANAEQPFVTGMAGARLGFPLDADRYVGLAGQLYGNTDASGWSELIGGGALGLYTVGDPDDDVITYATGAVNIDTDWLAVGAVSGQWDRPHRKSDGIAELWLGVGEGAGYLGMIGWRRHARALNGNHWRIDLAVGSAGLLEVAPLIPFPWLSISCDFGA